MSEELTVFWKWGQRCLFLLFCQLALLSNGANASVAVKLNDTLAANENVADYWVSSDGSFVIYKVTGGSNPKFYRADIGGGTPLLLATITWADASVEEVELSPDDRYLAMKVVSSDQESVVVLSVDGIGGLRHVDESDGRWVYYKWSSDGRHLVFNVVHVDTFYYKSQIHSAFVPENPSTDLPDAVELYKQTAGETLDFRITPDGQTAIFCVSTATNPGFFRVPVTGVNAAERFGTIPQTNYDFTAFEVSPDGSMVLYQRLRGSSFVLVTLDVNGDVDQGSATVAMASDSHHDFEMRFSPNGNRIFYQMPDDSLWSRISDGSEPAVELFGGAVSSFEVLPDDSRVVMLVSGAELRSVSVSGGNSTLLGSGVSRFLVSPDGSKVVFQAEEVVDDYAIFAVGPTGDDLTRLVYGGGIKRIVEISEDEKRLIYQKPLSPSGHMLFSVSLVMGTPSPLDAPELNLTGNLVSGGAVYSEELTTGGEYLIYRADQDTDGVDEIYSKRLQVEWNPVTRNPGAPWELPNHWDGGMPNAARSALIAHEKTCVLSDAGAIANWVEVKGGSTFDAVLSMSGSAGLSAPAGVVVGYNGIVKGNGTIDTSNGFIAIESGGEIQVEENELLTINGSGVMGLINRGVINTTGTQAEELAQMRFSKLVENRNSIVADYASLRFDGGFQNRGSLTIGESARIIGDVVNVENSGASIQVNGYANFIGNLINGSSFSVGGGAHLRMSGSLKGYGIHSYPDGFIYIHGIISPGFDSGQHIAPMIFTNDLELLNSAVVKMELGGTTAATQYDVIRVADHLDLGGTLDVSLLDSVTFRPSAGDIFDLMDAASVSGEFQSIELPDLSMGLYWHDNRISGAVAADWTGEISVGLTPETYAEFATVYDLTGTASDDDDGDGIPNLLEYVLATHPKHLASETRAPSLQRVAGNDEFSVDIAVPGSSDVKLEMQRSIDMNEWTTLSTRNADGNWTGTYTPQMSQVEQGRKQYKVMVPVGDGRCFYRVKATQR